jgi:hypothetical protein
MSGLPRITVAIPTYNAAAFLQATLDSLSAQTHQDFEVLVVDDASRDETCALVERHGFPSLRIHRNPTNRGCTHTIPLCAQLATHDLLVYLCHDDLLAPNALAHIAGAFRDPSIGAVTRPLFWFEGDRLDHPLRVVRPFSEQQDTVIRINDEESKLHSLITTLGQLSALGFRRSMMTVPFTNDVFTVHIQAFLGVFREHPVVMLSDYVLAVRSETSQSRTLGSIYRRSPLLSWDEMLKSVFSDPRHAHALHACRRTICTENDVGLIQVKCTGGMRALLQEIGVSIRVWPMNAIRPHFLFWCLVTLLLPRRWLRWSIDRLKQILGPRVAAGVRLSGGCMST